MVVPSRIVWMGAVSFGVFGAADVARAQSGHLFLPEVTVAGAPATGIAARDMNADGFDDVVAFGGSIDLRELAVFEGGPGGLTAVQTLPVAGYPASQWEPLAIGDFNGDGRPDVVGVDFFGLLLFTQGATGELAPPVALATPEPYLVRAGDFNADDLDDVVVMSWGSDTVDVFYQGTTGLGAPTTYTVVHQGFDDLDVGDLDGDNLDDIIVMSGQGLVDHIGALLQRPGGFAPPVYVSVADQRSPRCIGVGDVTGDGADDVVITYTFPSSFELAILSYTDAGFAAPVMQPSPGTSATAIDILDLTGDGRDDLLLLPSGTAFAQGADGALMELAAAGDSIPGPQGAAFGDFDGDALMDMVVPVGMGGVSVSYGTRADLAVTSSVTPDPALVETEATFTMQVTNNGPDDATEVTLTFEPDEGLSGWLSSDDATCESRSCTIGALAAGASATVTFEANLHEVGTFGAAVALAAYNFDPDLANDSVAPSVTVVPAADLTVGLGQTYRQNGTVDGALLIFGNRGPYAAEAVRITIELDPGMSYQGYEGVEGAPAPGTCTAAGSTVTCEADTLDVVDVFEDQTGTQIHLLLSGSGTVSATIESDTGDPDLSNNSASVTVNGASGSSDEADMGPVGPGSKALSGDDGGCGCRMAARRDGKRSTAGWVLLLAMAGAVGRRLFHHGNPGHGVPRKSCS